MTLIVSCSRCGSQRIAHQERTVVQYEVKAFTFTLAGKLAGEEFTGPALPDWEHAEPVEHPWHCLVCHADLQEHELTVLHSAKSLPMPQSATLH